MNTHAHLPFCVYVLLSEKDGNFYIGFSTDLETRLEDHQKGRNISTASRRPLKMIHAEFYLSKTDALRRENYLKTAKGRRVLRLMLQNGLKDFSTG